MFTDSADANRLAALARAMASNPAWGSDDVRVLILRASGRIEVAAGDVPGVPLQGVHSPNPALDVISDQIAAQYGCPLDAHRSLLSEIEFRTNTLPAEVRKNGVPIVTTKSSKWRAFSREAVPLWCKRLSQGATADELFVLTVAIDGDELLFRICRHLNVYDDLIRLMSDLEEGGFTPDDIGEASDTLTAILKKLRAYKAPKSRPALDETVVAGAKAAKEFWLQHRGKATVEFYRDQATKPKSEFAGWFCTVMEATCGLTIVQSRSLLDKHV